MWSSRESTKAKWHKGKERQSGELTEAEGLLEELSEINEETERRVEGENEIKKANVEKEKNQAMEMRQRAMERYGETKREKVGKIMGIQKERGESQEIHSNG